MYVDQLFAEIVVRFYSLVNLFHGKKAGSKEGHGKLEPSTNHTSETDDEWLDCVALS